MHKKASAAAEYFTEAFRNNITGIRGEQFSRIELRQIAQRDGILHHLQIALYFEIAATNQRGKLLAIA